ncbi:hypothetical protein B0W47_16645 (plasmid) [Komagataeibacter nataicola]|uniref:Uncharacterized protein n=1 Tax=Komagataeibacter nataicola TaxID=265960 RepID=A0A9N7CQP9_9PROT|nr:hypothetical protein [Komagataeibacter nataicola]AQU89209.1 hypothetical protein B0W47_16645 [Komagataeibacter nataicola]PYD66276.1 hypothetical protein CDI09_09005 [Komagataeibacter nataicola]GBR23396.1 hypothetical protein AA0616_2512 [Komagataeibacter nataicola NRIC 0616]
MKLIYMIPFLALCVPQAHAITPDQIINYKDVIEDRRVHSDYAKGNLYSVGKYGMTTAQLSEVGLLNTDMNSGAEWNDAKVVVKSNQFGITDLQSFLKNVNAQSYYADRYLTLEAHKMSPDTFEYNVITPREYRDIFPHGIKLTPNSMALCIWNLNGQVCEKFIKEGTTGEKRIDAYMLSQILPYQL